MMKAQGIVVAIAVLGLFIESQSPILSAKPEPVQLRQALIQPMSLYSYQPFVSHNLEFASLDDLVRIHPHIKARYERRKAVPRPIKEGSRS